MADFQTTPNPKQIAQKVFDSGTNTIKISGSVTSTAPTTAPATDGRTVIAKSFVDYITTPVSTTVYKELIASTSDIINRIHIFDSSSQAMILALGGAGSEVDKFYIPPGGDNFDFLIPLGSRVSIKALTANAVDGYQVMGFFK